MNKNSSLTAAELAELNKDYQVKCYSGATRWQSELTAAFNRVAPFNWKDRIDSSVAGAVDIALICDAVVHFTGSVPTVRVDGFKVRFTADGYYATIGA